MRRLRSILGYSVAVLVLVILFLTPFDLMSRFTGLVGRLGVRPHPKFMGGPVVRTLDRGSYKVDISAPAGAVGPMEDMPRFIQVSWSPLSALPERIQEQLDLDGDGRPDVALAFDVPKDPARALHGDVQVLDSSKVLPLRELGRKDLDALLVRLDQRIVARFPVK